MTKQNQPVTTSPQQVGANDSGPLIPISVAWAGLICAVLLPPVGLATSVVGLVISARGSNSRRISVAGLVVSLVALFILSLVFVLPRVPGWVLQWFAPNGIG